jgi:hypothetical protein
VRPARIVTGDALVVRPWQANSDNWQPVQGRVLLGGAPVAGARVSVDDYILPAATRRDGSFTYPVDVTVAARHVVRVVDATRASVNGSAVGEAERARLLAAQGGISVGYGLTNLKAARRGNGILVTGRVQNSTGAAPPAAGLYTYQLRGTITDADGRPVQGAVVVTRTTDRDFWTFSSATDAQGRYTSYFPASDKAGNNPVPMSVQVAVGDTSYAHPFGVNVEFRQLSSSQMDLQLPTRGGRFAVPNPQPVAGAINRGLVVGASGPGGVVKPIQVRWPDARGNFSLLLPASLSGRTISLWQNLRVAFDPAAASPGAPLSLRTWPEALSPRVPSGLATIKLP